MPKSKFQLFLKALKGAKKAIVAVDPTDVDNLELLIAVIFTFGIKNTVVILTGRRALPPDQIRERTQAGETIQNSEWDEEYSKLLLKVSALRFQKLQKKFDYGSTCPIIDGGLASRVGVPHKVHMDDLTGFGDVTSEEVDQVANGQLTPLSPRSQIVQHLGTEDSIVVFLGGPATGINLLLKEQSKLCERIVGCFAQFGCLGNVELMKTEGRAGGVQYNALLDAKAGKEFCRTLDSRDIPLFLLPSDVTRSDYIGFGSHRMLDYLLKMQNLGMMELARLRRIWEQSAIRSVEGEVLRTHDLATLLFYMQLQERCGEIYEYRPVCISRFIVNGSRQGFIGFKGAEADSNVFAAIELKDPAEYVEVLRKVLSGGVRRPPTKVFLSASLSSEDMADPKRRKVYEARVMAQLCPRLDDGAQIHWGSHPSVQRVMKALAVHYPGQLVQFLQRKYASSRIAAIPDESVKWFGETDGEDGADEMIVQMVDGIEVGIFIGGREDLANMEDGESRMAYEHTVLLATNPRAQIIIDETVGGLANRILLSSTLHLLFRFINPKRLGKLLMSVRRG